MEHWDVVVVGGGPAGAACALAARRADPGARVLVLDRADFPRDKVCGDGIAPEALDVLAGLGLDPDALTAGYAERAPAAAALPRRDDGRADDAPAGAGRPPRRPRRPAARPRRSPPARSSAGTPSAGSRCARRTSSRRRADRRGGGRRGRRGVGRPAGGRDRPEPARTSWRSPSAATRPCPPGLDGVQLITTTEQRWPAYAWSFPLGDGRANVGYGELVSGGVTRGGLLAGLERLLPGVAPAELKAHRLPLSTGRPRQPDGRVLLAGDAASLINPLTGEGIFYAVLSGALAGAAAVRAPGRVRRTGPRCAGGWAGTCCTPRRRPGPAAGRG